MKIYFLLFVLYCRIEYFKYVLILRADTFIWNNWIKYLKLIYQWNSFWNNRTINTMFRFFRIILQKSYETFKETQKVHVNQVHKLCATIEHDIN